MRGRRSVTVVLAAWLCAGGRAEAAEACGNGIDDDADGLVDCLDTDCGLDLTCCAGDTTDDDGDRICDVLDACPLPGQGLTPFARSVVDASGGGDRLALADFDGDGLEDVLEWSGGSTAISWSRNLGSSYAPRITVSAGEYVRSVVATDFDGDGDIDLVSTGEDAQFRPLIGVYRNLGGGSFTARTVLAYLPGTDDFLATTADMDDDGDADLVYDDPASFDFGWMENTGGALGPSHVLSHVVPALWTAAAAVDLDGDGDLDLAVDATDDTMAWLLTFENLGGGAWGPERDVAALGGGSSTLAVGDLDGDGDVDLLPAVAEDLEYSYLPLSWFPNRGDGTFQARRALSGRVTEASTQVVVVDLDGDGDLDVVDADSDSWSRYHPDPGPIEWNENLGGGAFAAPVPVVKPGDQSPEALVVTDLGQDGRPDLVASEYEGGTWQLAAYRDDVTCHTLDTDGDGLTDVVELSVVGSDPLLVDSDGDGIGDGVEVDQGLDPTTADTDGDGVDDALDLCPLASDPGQEDADGDGLGDPCDLCLGDNATGDPDQDGVCEDRDVCVGDDAVGDRDGDGTCDDRDNCPSDPNPDQADADGDGVGLPCDRCVGDDAKGDSDGDQWCDDRDDCALVPDPVQPDADHDGAGDVCDTCPGPGSGLDLFAPAIRVARVQSPGVALDDVDADGHPDLVVGTFYVDPEFGFEFGHVEVYDGTGSGFGRVPHELYSGDSELTDLAVADVDRDGDLDVVTADSDLWWIRHDAGGWAPAARLAGSALAPSEYPAAVVVADLDGDGDGDVAWVTRSGTVAYDPKTPAGWGAEQVLAQDARGATDVLATDLDGDGDLDLVVSVADDDSLDEYRNDGLLGFSARIVLTSAVPGAAAVQVADLDGDGRDDLLASAASTGDIVVLRGLGGGTFAPPVTVATGLPTRDLVAADLDGDGDLDLAASSTSSGDVRWFEHRGGLRLGPGQLVDHDAFLAGRLAAGDVESDGDPDLAWGSGWAENLADCVELDADADGLTDAQELQVVGSDPNLPDTDGGGLADGLEVLQSGDPLVPTDDLGVSPPSPGRAGALNTVVVVDATPGGRVVLLSASSPGSAPTPVPACAAVATGLAAPAAMASGVADASGRAVLSGPVPAALAGHTTWHQVVDVASCRISPAATHTW